MEDGTASYGDQAAAPRVARRQRERLRQHVLACRCQVTREIVTLERMHRAFADGLMEVRMAGAGALPHVHPATTVHGLFAPLDNAAPHLCCFAHPSQMQYGMMTATKKLAA